MLIDADEFKAWLLSQPMDYKDKCCFAYLTDMYAKNFSIESQAKDKQYEEWERWLDGEIEYHKDDISKGLPSSVYNTVLRGTYYDDGYYKHMELKTNRDLYNTSDKKLESIRNMSDRKVKLVRDYIRANSKRIFGNSTKEE